MSYTTVDDAKAHLNLDPDFALDDKYISYLIEVAEDVVTRRMHIVLEEEIDEEGQLPPALRHAILLIVAQFYKDREAATDKRNFYTAVDRLSYLFVDYSK